MELKKFGNILKQEGTSRTERKSPALDPATVKIDERRLEDFLIYARQYTSHLRFERISDKQDIQRDTYSQPGSWEYFFSNDTAFLVAEIAVLSTSEIKNAFDRLYSR